VAELVIEEVTDVEVFSSLKERWDALLEESSDNNIFLTWEWLFIWWRHYGKGKQLRILLIKEQDKIIGILPLMQWQYKKGPFHVNVLENICAEECDYSGVILTERIDESIAVLLDYLSKITSDGKTFVRIWHVPIASSFLTVLQKSYPLYAKSLALDERLSSYCIYITLPATWEGYFQNLGRKTRRNIRRLSNLLERDHKVEFKKYSGDDEIQNKLEILFHLHQQRWQGKDNGSKFLETRAREFYIDASEAFQEKGWLDLSFLDIGGKIVSIEWGFNYDESYWSMTSSFDCDYSRYSVGNIHAMHLVKAAICNGQLKYYMLKGTEEYKSHYTKTKASNILITLSHNSLKGKFRVRSLNILIKLDNIRARSLGGNLDLLLKKIRSYTRNSKY